MYTQKRYRMHAPRRGAAASFGEVRNRSNRFPAKIAPRARQYIYFFARATRSQRVVSAYTPGSMRSLSQLSRQVSSLFYISCERGKRLRNGTTIESSFPRSRATFPRPSSLSCVVARASSVALPERWRTFQGRRTRHH